MPKAIKIKERIFKGILKITWRDSRLYLAQQDIDDGGFSACEVSSVGFVIFEGEHEIVLAGDLLDNDMRRAVLIPKENIIRTEKLCLNIK